MAFYDEEHKKRIKKILELWDRINELTELAATNGIKDIFQDNGAKVLQQLTLMDMKNLDGREGSDAIDRNGIEWEMKSANISLVSGFSTHHHLNFNILEKYKKVPWSFAFYDHSYLVEIYVLGKKEMKPMYDKWEDKLYDSTRQKNKEHINNPKISLKFVRENGYKVWPIDKSNPIDPSEVIKGKK